MTGGLFPRHRIASALLTSGIADGLLYGSRLTEKDIYAVFNPSLAKLEATGTGLLGEHPDLPDVLERYGIELEAIAS